MEDDQQFCLRWNNHQSTLIQNFDTLLESGTLVDCTLAAEGKYLKAHKVVLSACSPYFEGLLSEHYDKHPVFILKDVKFKELKAMMDYMYRGEVNISQDQLAALLKAAESLQIKGLSESRTSGSSKTDFRQQKVVPQTTSQMDIPQSSSGLTIEKNKVPRQGMAQGSVGDLPEDSASPQIPKGLSSREGSQSPTSRKRKKFRRKSIGDDNSIENHEASNSSDMPQQMSVPALGIAPVADEKVHADPTDSIGRSALMTQLTKPADEMLQLPLEKPEPNDNLIEPKSEYLEDQEESVEDLTLDDDMNDLNEMEQDNNRAGPSHDPSQHPGIGAWHVTGDRSNAGGVVGSVAGAPGTTDEVFLAAQEAAQAHRDSQDPSMYGQLHSSYIRPEMIGGGRSMQGGDAGGYQQPGRDFSKCSQQPPKPDESFLYVEAAGCRQEPPPPPPPPLPTSVSSRAHWPDSVSVQNSVPRKKFYCPRCNSGYTRLSDMKTHCHFQCGKEPRYQCPYCTKKAKFSSNMYVHVRRMHKDEKLQIIDLYKQLSRVSNNLPRQECY
ncbi:longitudinals lacking protein, isoforms A/B/D/L isoform X6 [Apis mellifera]|uniref:Longitudinals lacking protein, isoforms A/B/D/L isoform X6 n=1 Tax=Apis mellifera TaxID=7460 RepID=A0A7M7LSD3_APIME|nr:longitudinals lacking protein, isoforms A/B/D/L isoform X6 [Apis mellifera]|eukprot:XP_006567564.1 longitudinals lacking protein, isoforms A/B/D/L isoform X6 [Apis mellifera]